MTMCWGRKITAGCLANLLFCVNLAFFFFFWSKPWWWTYLESLCLLHVSSEIFQCNVALVRWCGIWANQLEPMNVDKRYLLEKLMNSRCDLSQSKGIFITAQCLWDELDQSLVGFSHTTVLLCTPVSMLWSAGALPQLCPEIHPINRLSLH